MTNLFHGTTRSVHTVFIVQVSLSLLLLPVWLPLISLLHLLHLPFLQM